MCNFAAIAVIDYPFSCKREICAADASTGFRPACIYAVWAAHSGLPIFGTRMRMLNRKGSVSIAPARHPLRFATGISAQMWARSEDDALWLAASNVSA
jgi:hypothetical protein